jgi:hypothetical protein
MLKSKFNQNKGSKITFKPLQKETNLIILTKLEITLFYFVNELRNKGGGTCLLIL